MSVQDKTTGKRRGQALAGALAGVAVIAVLVAVFIIIQVSGDDDDKTSAAPAASVPAAAPSQAAPEPSPAEPAPQTAVDPALQKKPAVTAGKGDLTKLVVTPVIVGKGPKVTAGQTIQANYVGATYKDGKQFESSWDTGQPAVFPVGVGQLIKGWDQGLVGVPVGSRVQLDIPAELAYGEHPTGGQPAGDLRFVVDILAAQ
ncbi:FKBP-type peptidyl-prolyl cis-trans isomerase [Actinoplanes sp. N902-109]|uniref:FKBP-type peptidyl-prolyl cis-trans isomerase n=1 Tax=Actinoplanes sp. (strain N902-109) TaxID=649831 RepID=UPI000329571E|nr:FKBP-type peptidyl-prolyl cis-trans isomerase [Actinoplanes sp. N902-109]AGL17330.1 FKBP-type peptidylprolyl isomerase [Actinoplanes sp. N902-109]